MACFEILSYTENSSSHIRPAILYEVSIKYANNQDALLSVYKCEACMSLISIYQLPIGLRSLPTAAQCATHVGHCGRPTFSFLALCNSSEKSYIIAGEEAPCPYACSVARRHKRKAARRITQHGFRLTQTENCLKLD